MAQSVSVQLTITFELANRYSLQTTHQLMDEPINTSPRMGRQLDRTADQSTSSRSLPSETTLRAGERTCTQKLYIPSLEKHDSSGANLWWRKFAQYIKMTKDIDLSTMTNSNEI